MRAYSRGIFGTSALLWVFVTAAVLLPSQTSIAGDSNAVPRAERDYILIGHPNPSTGPIAGFGEASPWADDRIVKWINDHGGIYIEEYGKKLPVKVKLIDTESDPTNTIKATISMIVQDRVDMIVTSHTPDTVNPASAVCEKYEVPCVSNDAPMEAWLANGPYKWTYHSFWTLDDLTDLYISIWDEYANQTNKVVGGMWPDDADGIAFQEAFHKKLSIRGYTFINYSGFARFCNDFSPAVNLFKSKNVQIVTGVMLFPNFVTFWRQCHKMNYIPKIVIEAKGILFPTDMQNIEEPLTRGLTTGIWWSPDFPFTSALTGETAKGLCNAWTAETGKQWTMVLGFSYAIFEVALDALIRAQSLDKEKIRKAIETTDLDTVIGHIKYNQQHYSVTPLVGGQWLKGSDGRWELMIVYNKQHPEIPKTGEMIFPLQNIQK